MTVIDIQKIKVIIGVRELLNISNLQVQEGQKIGVVGRNGSGKSTLFDVLAENREADVRQVSIYRRLELLPQLKRVDQKMSGGEVTQEYITQSFRKEPGILLADEPTTNLDTAHVEWVEKELNQFDGTLLLISHDRTLMDNICDTIWELEAGKITEYKGNYSEYVAQKENEKKHQYKEYEKFQQKKQQLEAAIVQKDLQAQRATKAPKNLTASEARIKGAKPYFAKLQKGLYQNKKALETRLEKLEIVEKPKEELKIQMDLPNTRAFKNKNIIRADNLSGQVPNKLLWQPSTFFIKGGDKVGIIGPNGSGKTTLLRKILENDDEQLYCSPAMKIGYFAQNLDVLNEGKTILENVTEDAFQSETLIRIVLARLGFYQEDVYKEVKVLSGGERVKVSLAKLFVGDFNTLILDEPTNYLDVYALEALESLLKEYTGTILFVTHDRHFVGEISNKILAIEEGELTAFTGSYSDFLNKDNSSTRNFLADELARIDNELAAVLSQLSIEPSEKLDDRFNQLLKEKKELEKENSNS